METQMKKSVLTVEFNAEIQKVWNAVTDNRNYQWRSDLAGVEILDNGRTFVEKTKKGVKTEFYITNKISCKIYEFDLRNRNMKGHFTGKFEKTEQGGTRLTLTEEVQIRGFFMNLAAGLTGALKSMQKTYAADLKRYLGEA